MKNFFLISIASILICSACKQSDSQVPQADAKEKPLESIIAGGYPYDSEAENAINDLADKITDTVSNPFTDVEERIKLAVEVDKLQHPNLPPATFPVVSAEIASEAFDKVRSLSELSIEHYQLDEMEEAISLNQQVIHEYEKIVGPFNESLSVVLFNLAFLYAENNQVDEAHATYQRVVDNVKMRHGNSYEESHHYAYALEPLVGFYVDQSAYAKAKPLAEQVLTTFEKYLGPDHYEIGPVLVNLGVIYQAEEENEKAQDALLQAIDIMKTHSARTRRYMNFMSKR